MARVKKTLIYVAHDNLNRHKGALKNASPDSHEIVLVESQRMLRSRRWHRQRIFFMLSAARHFANALRDEGFTVHYVKSETTSDGISSLGFESVIATEPASFRLSTSLAEIGVTFVENDFFLTPRSLFLEWASQQKSLKLENFYRWQRMRLDILMDGDRPLGGKWNLDSENRLPPPKEPHPWPEYPHFNRDELDNEVITDISGLDLAGAIDEAIWGTTRGAALKQLDFFLSKSFADFGPYEDAMTKDSWQVYHSLLSPYLNIGLITADEVIAAALQKFKTGKIPLQSCEGFVRQVIGWREYINGLYWHFGERYRESNSLAAHRILLPLFDDASKTQMVCVAENINDIHARAWVHHIPRLMVLSNLAALSEVNPEEFLDWMRRVFIDAADWVMVPNVIGMSLHADGGRMSTKPYVAGGAYISRMSNYCNSCRFNPKIRVGDDACPFTTLYWHYLNRHKEVFKKNHRMFQQINGIKRLNDLESTLVRGEELLDALERGEI